VSIVLSVFVFVMCVDKAWPASFKWNHRSLGAHKLHLLAKRGEGSETIKIIQITWNGTIGTCGGKTAGP
jgi:hypothetical protein